MFSALRPTAKNAFSPKNGPVPDLAVNAYPTPVPLLRPYHLPRSQVGQHLDLAGGEDVLLRLAG